MAPSTEELLNELSNAEETLPDSGLQVFVDLARQGLVRPPQLESLLFLREEEYRGCSQDDRLSLLLILDSIGMLPGRSDPFGAVLRETTQGGVFSMFKQGIRDESLELALFAANALGRSPANPEVVGFVFRCLRELEEDRDMPSWDQRVLAVLFSLARLLQRIPEEAEIRDSNEQNIHLLERLTSCGKVEIETGAFEVLALFAWFAREHQDLLAGLGVRLFARFPEVIAELERRGSERSFSRWGYSLYLTCVGVLKCLPEGRRPEDWDARESELLRAVRAHQPD